ncbi:MAG: hypothetical protein EOQ60_07770 [Mesorhizobium sp.]|nr:MAG: hypothetical protein EOQ60_07770 [Mesorhizobium sp.]
MLAGAGQRTQRLLDLVDAVGLPCPALNRRPDHRPGLLLHRAAIFGSQLAQQVLNSIVKVADRDAGHLIAPASN